MFTPLDTTDASTTNRAPLARISVAWIGVVLLVTTGCRTARDNQFDVLERELRTQEDYIYELEDYVVEYSEKLRQCRCSQPTVVDSKSSDSKSVVNHKRSSSDQRRSEPLQFDEEPLYEPGDELPEREEEPTDMNPDETTPEEFEIPELEIDEPLSQIQDATGGQTLYIPEPVAEAEPELQRGMNVEKIMAAEHRIDLWDTPSEDTPSAPAERVVIAHLFRSEAGKAPPSTLLAVVEALNRDNEPIEFPGEVSLMVMAGDSEKPQRLKRWDFEPEDAAVAWQSSHLGDGLHLELPLGETKLPDVPLELWVRIVGEDGHKLLAQLPFNRDRLTALEAETGARELVAEDASDDDQSLASAKPLSEAPSDQQTGWRASTELDSIIAEGYASTSQKTGGWTAQPEGGRFPEAVPATTQSTTSSSGVGPAWTAGRSAVAPGLIGSSPDWSPQR